MNNKGLKRTSSIRQTRLMAEEGAANEGDNTARNVTFSPHSSTYKNATSM